MVKMHYYIRYITNFVYSEKSFTFSVTCLTSSLQCSYIFIHWPLQCLSVLTSPSDREYHLDVCTDLTQRSLIMIKTISTERQREKLSVRPCLPLSAASWLQLLSVTASVWIMQWSPALACSAMLAYVHTRLLTWEKEAKGFLEWWKPSWYKNSSNVGA